MLAPLAGPGVELVGLVKDMPAADIQSLDGMPGLRRYGESLADFSDTAALIQALDLVIGVDSAVIHLAGALGKPCWLMLRYSGEWRWGRARSDSPWYPTTADFSPAGARRTGSRWWPDRRRASSNGVGIV